MNTLIVVAVLALLLAWVLKTIYAGSRKPLPKPAEDLGSIRVSDARPGDSISVSAAGDDYSDLDFSVDGRNRYDVGPRQWIELRGSYRNRRVGVELFAGEDAEAGVVRDARKIPLDELGLSEEDLSDMDERQNTADNFEYDGKTWRYRMSKEFVLLRDSASQGLSFYGWLFDEDGGRRTLLVRKPEGEPFWATLATRANPGEITVYRA